MTTSTTMPTTGGPLCPRCDRAASISSKHPVCARCHEAVRTQAAQQQERDCLVRSLHDRVDASGQPVESALAVHPADRREIARMVHEARRLKLDWTKPPAPIHFDKRLAALLAPYNDTTRAGNKRGRPARPMQVCLDGWEGGAA